MTASIDSSARTVTDQSPAVSMKPLAAKRLWLAIAMIAAYWAFTFGMQSLDVITFVRWISGMAAGFLLMLVFSIWWLRNGGVSRRDRWLMFLAAVAGFAIDCFVADKSYSWLSLLLYCTPYVLTAATIWLIMACFVPLPLPRAGLIAVMLATWGYFTLIRIDGIDGNQRAAVHWRWTPTAEDLYLQSKSASSNDSAVSAIKTQKPMEGTKLISGPADWTGFRGSDREANVCGVRVSTDWNTNPPRQIWRQRIGPAWSSMVVVQNVLFTQEQRAESEAVICLDADTGHEIWAHEDKVRFWEAVSGAGPRATPTFADGRIYAVGATGLLNCLNARTGDVIWSRDFAKESQASIPGWGFCSSPLVVGNVVVVFAGGKDDYGLLAYNIDSGEPAWRVATGQGSYSSPHLLTIDGVQQILCLSDGGLIAVQPESGKTFWKFGTATPGAPISLQPHPLEGSRLLIPSIADLGMALLQVKRSGDEWTADKLWPSRSLRPSFNDFVSHNGAAYGFDEAIFVCFDLQTGKRLWKGGRYGHGQVLAIADQDLLLVLSETGEAVLLKTNPDQLDEVCRFQAIEGKTWNHPALVPGRLFVRNAEEIACYDVEGETR